MKNGAATQEPQIAKMKKQFANTTVFWGEHISLSVFLTDEEVDEYSVPGIQHLQCEKGIYHHAIPEL